MKRIENFIQIEYDAYEHLERDVLMRKSTATFFTLTPGLGLYVMEIWRRKLTAIYTTNLWSTLRGVVGAGSRPA
jgi:hypothetical protein